MTASMKLLIRPPRECEWPACRMLLPRMFADGHGAGCRLAIAPASPFIVAAAAFRPCGSEWTALTMHVVPRFRKQGIGTDLLNRLMEEAAADGMRTLTGWVESSLDPDMAAFLEAHAFNVGEQLYQVEGELATMSARVQAFCQRLRLLGRIPPDTVVAALSPDDWESVLALHSDHVSSNARLAAGGLPMVLFPNLVSHSAVLRQGGHVAGFILCHCACDVVNTTSLVVPRGSGTPWAAALLLGRAMESVSMTGARWARYEFLADNIPMRNLTRHFGMRTLGVRTAMVRAVDARSASTPMSRSAFGRLASGR